MSNFGIDLNAYVVRYRLTFIFIFLLSWLSSVCCQERRNDSRSTAHSLAAADTFYTVSAPHPSFRQPLKDADAARQKKFVRVTAKEIINPALVPITLDLYLLSGDKAEFLGSVAPYPANHPGSFIIATGGKLETAGVLELRLMFPAEWNKHDRLEVKVSRLTLE